MDFYYVCSECQKEFEIRPDLMLCPYCSSNQQKDAPLRGILEVKSDKKIDKNFDIYDFLPVEKEYFPHLPVGNTPLWKPFNLTKKLGFNNLYIKDDGANPTSSFKDRASFLVSAFAKKFSISEITLASTGNAGSSMAGIGAAAGQRITLFLPAKAPFEKLVQALQYGAIVHRVDGNYDAAYDLSVAYTEKFGGMTRNTGLNPMTIEGKKTVSIEIFNDLKKAPDYIFVATGDGCILSGVYKGFYDLNKLKFIDKMPVIYSVQAKSSNALLKAFIAGKFEKISASTIADSICVDVPKNGFHALSKLKKYKGRVISVSDDEIIKAQAKLSKSAGIFTEPAGAAAFAGFLCVKDQLEKDATIVILATGNGLKDTKTAAKGVKLPDKIISSIDEIS